MVGQDSVGSDVGNGAVHHQTTGTPFRDHHTQFSKSHPWKLTLKGFKTIRNFNDETCINLVLDQRGNDIRMVQRTLPRRVAREQRDWFINGGCQRWPCRGRSQSLIELQEEICIGIFELAGKLMPQHQSERLTRLNCE